jgi:hypothetical protein
LREALVVGEDLAVEPACACEDDRVWKAPEEGEVDVIVNYTNCVQCGAITAKGGRLTVPEGGDGPLYQIL